MGRPYIPPSVHFDFSTMELTMETPLFENCILHTQNNDTVTLNQTAILQCISNSLQASVVESRQFSRSVLLVIAAALVFFMQAGFAMVCAGAVRKKNVQNTLLKNLLDACGASVAFFAVGYAFAFGGMNERSPVKTFIGTTNFFLMNVNDLGFWLFQYAFSAASATIIAGTLAERCQMAAYLCYSVMLVGWVYPIIVHAIWNPQGFLSAYSVEPLWGVGMMDFAGSGVVHVTGGVTALFATIILGPRRGRFHDETGRKLEIPNEFPGHSKALQMLGTFILWFGWYGFNSGSALVGTVRNTGEIAALAGVNTTLAGGTAGMVALFLNLYLLERTTGEPYFDVRYAMNGSLCGLVAITAGCGVVEPWAAVVIGVFAGMIYIAGSNLLIRLRLDDAVDAIPVHMFNGIWGVLAVGFFASPLRLLDVYGHANHPGWVYSFQYGSSNGTLLGVQCVGLLFIMGWVGAIMFPFFIWLDWKGWFRSDPLEEIVGLDTSYHGGLALLAGGSDEVNPEYITAYKKQKEQHLRNRKTTRGVTPNNSSGPTVVDMEDDLDGGLAAAAGNNGVTVPSDDDDEDFDPNRSLMDDDDEHFSDDNIARAVQQQRTRRNEEEDLDENNDDDEEDVLVHDV